MLVEEQGGLYQLQFHQSKDGRPIPSLQGLDTHGNVIYIGTFSKVLSRIAGGVYGAARCP